MDIYFYGQAMFKLKGKTATVFIDPYKADYTGLKLPRDLAAGVNFIEVNAFDSEGNNKTVTKSVYLEEKKQ